MIARLPRVIYTELPQGQDWTVGEIDDEKVILISEDLDRDARRAAFRAAYASLRKGWPAWLPLPLIAMWVGRRARTPLGAAVMASMMTATAAYALTLTASEPRPIADPPAVVTLTAAPSEPGTPSPAATSARPTSSATHRPARPAATRPATQAAPQRDRSSAPRPTRSAGPRNDRPTPHPSPTSAPATAAATSTTQAPAPEAALEPPAAGTRSRPTRTQSEASAEEADAPEVEEPAPMEAGATCSGIPVGATVGPILGVDICLFG